MSSVNEKMATICNNIREKTGGVELLGLDEIATSIDDVYEAGKDVGKDVGKAEEHKAFWDNYIGSGNLYYYPYCFAGQGWKTSTFLPTTNLVFKGNSTGLFRQCNITNLKQNLKKCNVTMDTSQATNLEYAFAFSKITHLPKISLVGVGNKTDYIFAGTSGDRGRIVSIDELEVATTTTITSNAFNYCSDLTHLIMSGTLAKNGLNLQWSTFLDRESLLSILNCLKDYSSDTSGTEWVITLGDENIAKLTSDELLIATNKGWDVR